MTDLWRTSLDEAVRYRQDSVADLLHESGGKHGYEISLAGAIAGGNLLWVKKHLAAGVDLNQKIDGELPICIALQFHSQEVLDFLLRKKPDVQKTQGPRDTPLHIAVEFNRYESTLTTLLRLGEQLYTIHKATEILSVDETFVLRLVKNGKLRQVHLDPQTPRTPESRLSRYLSSLQQ